MLPRTAISAFLCAGILLATPGHSAQSAAQASIHVSGKPPTAQRIALSKITFLNAMRAALTAVPGRVASGDLEVDEGRLIYDFVIVTPAGVAKDVEIDAGNGAVLSIDDADED